MPYSPIDTIRIKNFRNLGDVELDFHDSPIISLIGENESGKTSVVKAVGVCSLNATPRDQKDYIRDGTTGFGVEITLQDKTKITRIKTASINRYVVNRPDGTMWEASKLEGLPKEVQEVMGMIEEPETKEFLHIRTYENQLLFVVTPASTNYKVMYDALKVGQITSAVKTGSVEANKLKAKINEAEHGIDALNTTKGSIKVYDIEGLINLRDSIKKRQSSIAKMEQIIDMLARTDKAKSELGSLGLLDQVTSINETLALRVESIGRILSRISEIEKVKSVYSDVDTAEKIDLTGLSKISQIINMQDSIEAKVRESGALAEAINAPIIPVSNIVNLERAMSLCKSVNHSARIYAIYSQIDTAPEVNISTLGIKDIADRIENMETYNKQASDSCNQLDAYIDQVLAWMKSVGVATVTCPRCGEDVVMDVSGYTD